MSQASAELAELLTELRATEGKVARGKLLLRGGKLFKGMSTDERIRVAYTLGVDNVGELLLKMDQDQLTDEDLATLVERAEQLDPVEVGALIRDLDDPLARKEAVHGLVDEFVTPPQDGGQVRNDLEADEEYEEYDEDEARPDEAAERDEAAENEEPSGPPEVPGRPLEHPPPDLGTAGPLSEEAGTQIEPVSATPAAPPDPTTSALAAAVGAVTSSVAQLRTLRIRTDEAAELTSAQLRHLVRTFPEGWRRRRAVSTLLADGVPASFDAALEVLSELPAEADWVWAASTLVRERELASDSLNRLLQAAPSERARQRIAMRAS